MRTLILTSGSPASGKSTWIKESGLEMYTLSADNIRLLYQSPLMTADGGFAISQKNDRRVWELLYSLLEERMSRGELTVVDATHSSSKSFGAYKKLAEKYRYNFLTIDFRDVPIETAKKQNRQRDSYKFVPEEVIDNMYLRFATQPIPNYANPIKPYEFWDKMEFGKYDVSKYEKIQFIGDIHGCYTSLKNLLSIGICKDTLYVFTGDYIDRGVENAEVLNFLISIMDSPNVILLEGNHERHLWNYANDEPLKSKEFRDYTIRQIEGVSKKSIRMFYRKLRQIAYLKFGEKTIIATHGGVSSLCPNMRYIATEQFVRGVGEYKDDVNKVFEENTDEFTYQIHGHRNVQQFPVMTSKRTANLEGGVEIGGCLRSVIFHKDGRIETKEIANTIIDERFKQKEKKEVIKTVDEFVKELRSSKSIREKHLKGGISSFNFTRDTFYGKSWDDTNIKARGMFINTNTNKIVSRAYEKFFNIGELESTKIENLQKSLVFPINIYVKENGYLGILGYDEESDELIYCSKSTINGDYARWFKGIFMSKTTFGDRERIKTYLKMSNTCMVFEVIEPVEDAHIIKYTEPQMVLLDIVYRTPKFEKIDYFDMTLIALDFGIRCKEKMGVLRTWEDFVDWYTEVTKKNYKYAEEYVEGFVLEDSVGFMTKIKCDYYTFWKQMRGVVSNVINGKSVKKETVNNRTSNEFCKWLMHDNDKETLKNSNIIELRDKFCEYKNEERNVLIL